MLVKISDLREGDMVKASWLGTYRGSEWHEVKQIAPSSADAHKLRVMIEGFGSREFDRNETIERQ